MIFVTVGTHDQQFNRLVIAADELASFLPEKIVIQRGASNYIPRYADHFDFATSTQIQVWISQARVVIAQAGAGTILTVLDYKKPLIIVPRLSAFGENYNDHQLQLANALTEQKRAVCVLHPTGESLLNAINTALETNHASSQQPTTLITALRNQLLVWERESSKRTT